MEMWSGGAKLSNLESAMATLIEAFRHTISLIRADLPPREMMQQDGAWKGRSGETNGSIYGSIYNNRGKLGRKSEIVRLKTEELRQQSSPSNPLCFRCGKPGHLSYYCPNSIVCFVCGNHGHRARECSSPQVEELVTEDTTYQLEMGQATKGTEKGEQEVEEAGCLEVVNQKNAVTEVAQQIEMSNLEIQRLSKELLETKVELGVCKEEYTLLKRSFDNMISGLKMEKDKLIASITALEGKINDDLNNQLVAITKERDDLMSANEKLCSELHEADMLRKDSDSMIIRGRELDVRGRNIVVESDSQQKIEVLSGSEEKKLVKNKMKKTQSAKGRPKKVQTKIFQTESDGEGGIVIKLVDPG